jgi:hypothetical protein
MSIEYNPKFVPLGAHTSDAERRKALYEKLAKLERALAVQQNPRRQEFLREQIDELKRQLLGR